MLLNGNRTADYTTSRLLHHSLMFWLDEGLVEQGFWIPITSDYYVGDINLREAELVEGNMFKIPYDRIVWQTGVNTVFGEAHRPSGIYAKTTYSNGESPYYLTNEGTEYHIDYHYGVIELTQSGVDILSASGITNPSSIPLDYCAKQVYVAYKNDDVVKTQLSYINSNWDNGNNLENMPYKIPMIVGTLTDQTIRPYEIGGTRYFNADYKLMVISDNEETRDQIADVIAKQKNMTILTKKWGSLYNDSGTIAYSSVDGYITACSSWKDCYIDDLRETRYSRGGIFFADYNLTIRVINIL